MPPGGSWDLLGRQDKVTSSFAVKTKVELQIFGKLGLEVCVFIF